MKTGKHEVDEQDLVRAARELCRLRGQDPHQLVQHGAPPGPDGAVPAVALYTEGWRIAYDELIDAIRVQSVLYPNPPDDQGIGTPTRVGGTEAEGPEPDDEPEGLEEQLRAAREEADDLRALVEAFLDATDWVERPTSRLRQVRHIAERTLGHEEGKS